MINLCNPSQSLVVFSRDKRKITLVSSLEVSPVNGRLWATWYTGVLPGENHANYCILATSADGGDSWEEVFVADPAIQTARAFDPEVWIAPDGRLRWTWAERDVGASADLDNAWDGMQGIPTDRLMCVELDAEQAPDGPPPVPRKIAKGVMMCKPSILVDGSWLLPVARWNAAPSACFWRSCDGGRTFQKMGGITLPEEERKFDEHQVIQRANGSLRCLIRTARTGLYESFSNDGGLTWHDTMPSALGHPSARLFFRRLASGRILLVKHGAIGETCGRERLMAFLSEDEGETWLGGLLLDARAGISYPDGCQRTDGTILITYDFDRNVSQAIHFCEFTEKDVLAGHDVSGQVKLARIITSATDYQRIRPLGVQAGDVAKIELRA